MNPADDRAFVRPLVKSLHRHVDQLADSIPGTNTHDDHQRRHKIAAAWVYMSAVVAWAEDHQLIDITLRAGLRKVPARYTAGHARPVAALAQAMGHPTAHPATQWLMHPAYNTALHAGTPSDDAVQALADWWAGDAPSLAYTAGSGPPSISGWIIGDLLQTITNERRKSFALAQTPWWVCDFILDRTMLPALNEFRRERMARTIDPTAGTGHMLIRAMDYLWDWYTTGRCEPRSAGSPATGGTIVAPVHALPRVVASLDGIELDPLTAAVARLRLTVYASHLAHRAGLCETQPRIDQIPRTLIPRVGVGDSLLLGKVDRDTYARHHPQLAVLPGASFVGGDWAWEQPDTLTPAPVQLDLFGEAA